MPDSYVIDGYNLIHALGMIQRQMAPGGLEDSRRQLLVFLAKAFGAEAPHVTIVFDAKQAPRGLPRQQQYRGLRVQFAPSKQSADDAIETLIDEASQPRSLVVVSNDHRLQKAAEQRAARAWTHEALLDFLEKRTEPKTPLAPTEKSGTMPPEELQRWLKEFGWLESDPELKEFFDLDKFE